MYGKLKECMKAHRFYRAKKVLFLICSVVLLFFVSGSCKYYNGVYYFYLSTPPKITTDSREAGIHRYFTKKELNDSVYYYYAEGKHSVTKDSVKAKYTTRIGQFRHGEPVKLVWLDGLGDTMRVECYEKNWKRQSVAQYYGEKHIELRREYKDGKQHGTAEYYYSNGNLRQKSFWKEGRMNGEYFNYYPNGQLRIKGYYADDQQDKTFLYLDEQGDTLKIEHWDKGILIDSMSYKSTSY